MAELTDPLRRSPLGSVSLDDEAFAVRAASGVSWGAIFAGAVGACALSLILLLLGTGLGMSSVSPWSGQGASATAIGISAIAWITFTQIASSGMGGYLAGRLRTKWAGVHTDEVYFRDTAHGFLAWAVATLITAALLTSTIGAILGTGAQAGATVAGGAASAATSAMTGTPGAGAGREESAGRSAYFIDALFRKDPNAAAAPADGAAAAQQATTERSGTAASVEAGRIFANGIRAGSLPPEDTRYAGQLVAQRTGLSQQDAEKRVNDTFTRAQAGLKDAEDKARAAADTARKASAYSTLWIFISLLIGAFVASLSATYGGRRRDL